MQNLNSPEHRADIQVLRGIAVLAVIFYHLGLPIHGGFLGVDSFFVISGYVITGTLLRSSGTLKTRTILFYKKRIRRIFPSSIYIASLTLFASFLFLPRIYLKNYFFDSASSLFMVANIRFARGGVDYLQTTLHASPFLHFWSLGVEEQFYFLWPVMLLVLFRNKALYYFAVPAFFLISIVTTLISPTASFFSPTSRAWEFLVGAYVATLPKYLNRNRFKSVTLFIMTLILLISLIFASPKNNTFQFLALPVVLAVASLIYLGFSITLLRPLEKIGNISYSLYLIHWPIIGILLYYFNAIDKSGAVLIVLFCLVFSIFITANLENPIRFRQEYLKSKKFWISLITPIVILGLFAFSQGVSLTQSTKAFRINNSSPIIYKNGCHVSSAVPKKDGCDFGDLQSRKLIMLVGDSHAAQWFNGFESEAMNLGLKLRIATKSGCPAILITSNGLNTPLNKCTLWQNNVLNWIKASDPSMVVISNLTERSGGTNSQIDFTPETYVQSQLKFIERISPHTKVVVIGDTPFPGSDIVACLSLHWNASNKCDLKNAKSKLSDLTEMVSGPRIHYIDSRPFLCTKHICPSVINGWNAYRDGSHISVAIDDVQRNLAKKVLLILK